jgi:hypothetical protein
MIKAGMAPSFRRMAGSAILSQTALMQVIFRMAGKTSLTRRLQRGNRRRSRMALGTLRRRMFTVQFKSELVVVEIFPKTIHPVMTVKTIFPEHRVMPGHKRQIHAAMTVDTGLLVELCDIHPVTIRAEERFILSCELVRL